LVARSVFRTLFRLSMVAAVPLNNQPMAGAVEIEEGGFPGVLAPKSHSWQSACPNRLLEPAFCFG
jgi:hypothetical protein